MATLSDSEQFGNCYKLRNHGTGGEHWRDNGARARRCGIRDDHLFSKNGDAGTGERSALRPVNRCQVRLIVMPLPTTVIPPSDTVKPRARSAA